MRRVVASLVVAVQVVGCAARVEHPAPAPILAPTVTATPSVPAGLYFVRIRSTIRVADTASPTA
jgi:type IV secretory pathway protease TraF